MIDTVCNYPDPTRHSWFDDTSREDEAEERVRLQREWEDSLEEERNDL